jgi:hypothetical protein
VKTTLEIPDPIFRRAKLMAAERGIPLRQFVTEAIEEKMRSKRTAREKPWVMIAGKLQHLRDETGRINQLIEQEFGRVEAEE